MFRLQATNGLDSVVLADMMMMVALVYSVLVPRPRGDHILLAPPPAVYPASHVLATTRVDEPLYFVQLILGDGVPVYVFQVADNSTPRRRATSLAATPSQCEFLGLFSRVHLPIRSVPPWRLGSCYVIVGLGRYMTLP